MAKLLFFYLSEYTPRQALQYIELKFLRKLNLSVIKILTGLKKNLINWLLSVRFSHRRKLRDSTPPIYALNIVSSPYFF